MGVKEEEEDLRLPKKAEGHARLAVNVMTCVAGGGRWMVAPARACDCDEPRENGENGGEWRK